jgi:16S rRNA (uracil1498-N3)-methyltransferase
MLRNFQGPEGDFTKTEIDYAISKNAIPVSLGENILRTETASISALAIVSYEMGD